MCIRFSWLAAFSLALKVLFLLLTSFIVCHAIRDCLSSTECRILLIWSLMYSVYSFMYALISSLCAFLSFWPLALVGFLLLHRDAGFFAIILVCIYSAAASMWALTKFLYTSYTCGCKKIPFFFFSFTFSFSRFTHSPFSLSLSFLYPWIFLKF